MLLPLIHSLLTQQSFPTPPRVPGEEAEEGADSEWATVAEQAAVRGGGRQVRKPLGAGGADSRQGLPGVFVALTTLGSHT